jgi:hypothetical protein
MSGTAFNISTLVVQTNSNNTEQNIAFVWELAAQAIMYAFLASPLEL